MHDWARTTGASTVRRLIERRSLAFYAADRDAPLSYEPSGHDFLSPSLAEADLMRRVLPPDAYREWFAGFLGEFEIEPVTVPDVNDGHLVHLAGLNLSRAWMLEGIASVVPSEPLGAMATHHRAAGLAAMESLNYAGAHWLATFVAYLTTRRGIETTYDYAQRSGASTDDVGITTVAGRFFRATGVYDKSLVALTPRERRHRRAT